MIVIIFVILILKHRLMDAVLSDVAIYMDSWLVTVLVHVCTFVHVLEWMGVLLE